MGGTVKYLIIRLVLLGNLLILFNFIYESLIYEGDLQKHAPFVLELEEAIETADVIYLGDCSNAFYYQDDASLTSIAEYLDSISPLTVTGISRDGFHAGVYKDLIRRIPDSSGVQKVIVTINMRAFSPPILYGEHENEVWGQRILIQPRPPLLNRIRLGFKGYPWKTHRVAEKEIQAIWDSDTLAFSPSNNVVTLGQWRRSVLQESYPNLSEKVRFIENYGFSINTDSNTMIADLDELIELANSKSFDLIFHLLPEDDLTTQQVVGPELVKNLKQKQEVLRKHFQKRVEFIDNFTLLDQSGYAIPLPSSHYSARGREAIAISISKYL